MDFFLHSSTAWRRRKLLNLQARYGLAGIGFYWQAVELLMAHNYKLPISNFLELRCGPIRYNDVKIIIRTSDLFEVDEHDYVSLKPDKEGGIEENSIMAYQELLEKIENGDELPDSRTGACTSACTGTCTGTCTEACTDACTGAGYPNKDIDEDLRKEIEAQTKFNDFMSSRCPHLLDMDEPLTLDEYYKLKKNYSWKMIEDVLIEMENCKGLSKNRRSCYQTALSWLKKRENKQG